VIVKLCLGCSRRIPDPGPNRCRGCRSKRDAIRNATRPQYGARWRAISKAVIAAEPWCHWPGCDATADLTCDHILPVARGGTDDLHNLTVLCRHHNSQKGDHQ
jgi:5-methylcytosine-specific restriction endonuclease McrA